MQGLKPYKVYLKGKLNDLVYYSQGTTLKAVKSSLVSKGYANGIVVKHFMRSK